MIKTPSKKFSLNNIKKFIKGNEGKDYFLVIDAICVNDLKNLIPTGFSIDEKVCKNGRLCK